MREIDERKKYIVEAFLKHNLLLDMGLYDLLADAENVAKAHAYVRASSSPEQLLYLNEHFIRILSEEPRASIVVDVPSSASVPRTSDALSRVRIVSAFEHTEKKLVIDNFVEHFRKRYTTLQQILIQRREIQEKVLSIHKVNAKKDRENVAVVCMVKVKQMTKNGNIVLEVEDLTGETKILINKTKPEIFAKGMEIVEDEVIGVLGTNGEGIIFANDIIFPDVPITKEFRKSPDEVYAAFLSDIHFGSKNFLKAEFDRFIEWINGNLGSEKHRAMASNVRYLFITGDMVDGVGVYPRQDEELAVQDIYEQYSMAASYLAKIPRNVAIIICPGNHDALRLSEPQPLLPADIAAPLYALPNVIMTTNPSTINIHASADFPGLDVLMYHGYSYVYYGDKVDSLREKGGIDRTDLIMRFLLQKRHLAPTHGSALYMPEPSADNLVIERVPDIFVSGHVHKAAAADYRGVTTICSSCWQSITSFEEKLGLHPEPARLPVHNLQTRKTHIIKFGVD